MKTRQVKDGNNQHHVAIESGGLLYSYFSNSSLHACGVALQSLQRDIAKHGESFVDFSRLPTLVSRKARSGRVVFDIN